MHFFITGFMASGKSYWGKKLSAACALPHLDLDQYIEDTLQCSIASYFETQGEQAFRAVETTCLLEIIALEKPHIISCGGGTTCSETNRKHINESGYILFIDEALRTIQARLRKEYAHRPLLSSFSGDALLQEIERLYTLRKSCYENYHFRFIPGSTDPATFAAFILHHA